MLNSYCDLDPLKLANVVSWHIDRYTSVHDFYSVIGDSVSRSFEMAAEIKPGVKFATTRKPELVGKVEGFTDDLNDAALIPGEDGVITAGDDK